MTWISCKERMPEKYENVLFFSSWEIPDGMAAGYWNGRAWVPVGRAEGDSPGIEWWVQEEVTHWMPLPEPPKV